MYHTFIGIDISKAEVVVARQGHAAVAVFSNDDKGYEAFYQQYGEVPEKTLVVLETTGGYEMDLVEFLMEKKVAVHRADTRKVKHFIRSHGTKAKSDAVDAKSLALYGSERYEILALFKGKSAQAKELAQLTRRRMDIKQMLVQEKNRAQTPQQQWIAKSCEAVIEVLEAQIVEMDRKINQLIEADNEWKSKQKTLQSIAGIGPIVSNYLIALLPELGQLDRRRVASLVGLAPYPCESGQRKGYRKTYGGRQEVRGILFMAAMTASRSRSALGDFYRHLLAKGKPKMVAMTALMRKIIVIANARVAELFKTLAQATT